MGSLVVSAYWAPSSVPVVWPAAFFWMGLACLKNAIRCRRRHCFYTGPFFLLLGIVSVLMAIDVIPAGSNGWSGLGLLALVGGVLLTYLPDRLWGPYLGSSDKTG